MDPSVGQNQQYILSDTTRQVSNFGSKDIHLKRMRVSVLWSMILQIMFLVLFIFTIYFDLFHPISWIMNSLRVCLSLSSWSKLALLIAVIHIQGEVCKKDYVNGPTYHTTRFQKMKHAFSLRNLLLLVFHITIGLTIFWIYSSLLRGEYESLTRQCTDVYNRVNHLDYCLVESKLFLLLGGVWLGIYYFIIDYSFGSHSLAFPLIQQYKIYRVKAALKENIKRSVKDSIMPTVIFIFLYYLYGGYIRSKFINMLSVRQDLEPLDSVKILMNIQLIFFLWLFSSIFIVALHMMELLFNVQLTEHCVFPVSTSMLPVENYISLVDALKTTNAPIVYHLGYLDLFTLSTKCRERREELFTLSHPGGHPRSWNGICCESINLIQKFTNDLNLALRQGSISEKEVKKTTEKEGEITGFHFHSHGIRKLASPICKDGSSIERLQLPVYQSGVEIAFNHVQSWWNLKLEQFRRKPYIAYFFAESPDSQINYLLFQSQPVIWAVQSLVFLAAASLTEDDYGIVQRDLQNIIITIINLKQSLDKLFKQSLIVKKSFANDPLDVQMKYRLRTAVKRSLYGLAISFGPYIKDMRLPTDAELQMKNFIAFKELL